MCNMRWRGEGAVEEGRLREIDNSRDNRRTTTQSMKLCMVVVGMCILMGMLMWVGVHNERNVIHSTRCNHHTRTAQAPRRHYAITTQALRRHHAGTTQSLLSHYAASHHTARRTQRAVTTQSPRSHHAATTQSPCSTQTTNSHSLATMFIRIQATTIPPYKVAYSWASGTTLPFSAVLPTTPVCTLTCSILTSSSIPSSTLKIPHFLCHFNVDVLTPHKDCTRRT